MVLRPLGWFPEIDRIAAASSNSFSKFSILSSIDTIVTVAATPLGLPLQTSLCPGTNFSPQLKHRPFLKCMFLSSSLRDFGSFEGGGFVFGASIRKKFDSFASTRVFNNLGTVWAE